MGIYYDTDAATGDVRFHHSEILGEPLVPGTRTKAEAKAGKRPNMVENPDCKIPKGAKEISLADFDALMREQQSGKRIVLQAGSPKAIAHVRPTADEVAHNRSRRDRLLRDSDWTQLLDAPLTSAQQSQWAAYRTALRNLNPSRPSWPVAPNAQPNSDKDDGRKGK